LCSTKEIRDLPRNLSNNTIDMEENVIVKTVKVGANPPRKNNNNNNNKVRDRNENTRRTCSPVKTKECLLV
jgi:hypothetical protein